jgi:hypothetical protein
MEHRHGRSRKHLRRQRQQGLCFPCARRIAYAYSHSHCDADCITYIDRYCNCNPNFNSYSYCNSYRDSYSDRNSDFNCQSHADCNYAAADSHAYSYVHGNTQCYSDGYG